MRIKHLVYGSGLLALSAFSFFTSSQQSHWPKVDATVLGVTLECEMTATERGILTKTTSKATIDCKHVTAFKQTYPDKDWSVYEKYMGHLLVKGTPKSNVTEMILHPGKGHVPRVGDKLVVLQDPDDPGRVVDPSAPGSASSVTFALALVGLLLVGLGLVQNRRPAGRRQAVEPSIDLSTPAVPVPATVPATVAAQRPSFGRRNLTP